MLETEYDEAEVMNLFKEEGRLEGRQEGRLDMLISLVRQNLLSAESAADQIHMSVADFLQKLEG